MLLVIKKKQMLNLFKRKLKESYFSSFIFEIEDSEEMHQILAQTRIDKPTAENMHGAMKVIYKNEVADELILIEEGDYVDTEKVRYKNKPISYRDYSINVHKNLIEDKNGIHQLGGSPSEGFRMPDYNTGTPYIYLGKLNSTEELSLAWCKMDWIHLVCPIYAAIEIIYFDYTKPSEPKLLVPDHVDKMPKEHKAFNAKDKVIFYALAASFKKPNVSQYDEKLVLGNIGAPTWIQEELIPKCPRSGKAMKFLLSIETTTSVKLASSTLDINNEHAKLFYDETLNFGDGALYIFYEPDSKIMAYYIQNT